MYLGRISVQTVLWVQDLVQGDPFSSVSEPFSAGINSKKFPQKFRL